MSNSPFRRVEDTYNFSDHYKVVFQSTKLPKLQKHLSQVYDVYKKEVESRLGQHFRHLDSQIILVDLLSALEQGEAALHELQQAMQSALRFFRYGNQRGVMQWLSRKINRVVFAATKADQLVLSERLRLEKLLGALLNEIDPGNDIRARAEVQYRVIAALETTQSLIDDQGQEYLLGQEADGRCQPYYSGRVPDTLPIDWATLPEQLQVKHWAPLAQTANANQLRRNFVDSDLLRIPEMYWDAIAASFRAEDPMLYGRIDLSYNGQGPAKLLEANYDTPTSIFEAAYFQWNWLEDLKASGALPHGADQYNNLQDRMIEVFKGMGGHHETMHFSGISDIPEERSTVLYLQELAAQAGQKQKFVDIREVGIDLRENFVDPDGERIHRLFKLYPLETMFEEEFGKLLCKRDTLVIEPLWKAVISNKAILPMLWEFFPGHKNLLPAYFEGDPNASRLGPSYVRKPIFSREGANVRIVKGGSVLEETDGEYDKAPCILQAFAPLPEFDGDYPVIGSWVVGQTACGMGIREDRSRITKNSSRFVPHFIDG